MRRLRSLVLISLIFAATAGCKKKNDAGGGSDTTASGSAASGSGGSAASGSGGSAASGSAGSGSASGGSAASGSAGSGSAPSDQPQVNTPRPPDGSGSGSAAPIDTANMAHKAGNCPSTVAGAATDVSDSKDGKGVVLTITSKQKDGVWAIQTRAKHLAEVQGASDAKVEHTGKGTGGGGTGLCPVVAKNTKATVEETPDGVKITLVPTGDLKLDALKADIADRIKKSAMLTDETVKPAAGNGGTGGTGGGGGKHGGNRTGKGDGSGPRNGTGGGGGKGTGGGGGKGTGGGSAVHL